MWLFTTRLDVPATNNGSESAIGGFTLAAKVLGCWRTPATLQRHCRIRTYLVSARNHGRRPIDAIRDALTANPLDATPGSMIHRNHTPDCLRHPGQFVPDHRRSRGAGRTRRPPADRTSETASPTVTSAAARVPGAPMRRAHQPTASRTGEA